MSRTPTFKDDVPKIGPSDSMSKLARHHLRRGLGMLERWQPRAVGGRDPEGVHQMRLATRRGRAALRAFKHVLAPDGRRALSRELRWLAGVLGEVRDLDVHEARLRDSLAGPPAGETALDGYRRYVEAEERTARAELVRTLAGARYRRLLEDYRAFLEREPPAAFVGVVDGAADSISASAASLHRRGRRLGKQSAPAELHALRIGIKRLRYTLEFFTGFYGKRLDRPLSAAKKLQRLLGEYQDACMSVERLRRYCASVAPAALPGEDLAALEDLVAAEEQRARRARKRFDVKWPGLSAELRLRASSLRLLLRGPPPESR